MERGMETLQVVVIAMAMVLVQNIVHRRLEGRQSLAALHPHPHPHPLLPFHRYPTRWNVETVRRKVWLRFRDLSASAISTHFIAPINIRLLDYHGSIRFRTRIVKKKTFIERMGQVKLYTRRFGCLGKVIDIL